MSDELKVQNGQVVSMDYTLHVNGELLDTSEGREPLEFLQGSGNIIPGLERELYGMVIGESKDVTVAPADGYGTVDPQAYVEVPRNQFPEEIPMKTGTEIQVRDQSGQPMYARIEEVGDETVKLNFNHPLAGKELQFNVKIVRLRSATDEEVNHGHAHSPGHEHQH